MTICLLASLIDCSFSSNAFCQSPVCSQSVTTIARHEVRRHSALSWVRFARSSTVLIAVIICVVVDAVVVTCITTKCCSFSKLTAVVSDNS